MCLAIPAQVEEVHGDQAIVNIGGVRKEVALSLVEDVSPGDFLLVHVGYALNKISPEEAQRTLDIFAEAGMLGEQAP